MTSFKFPIEASHILMFARAIGDENPVFTDAEAAKSSEAGGIIAPPTFIQAQDQFNPEYKLRPKPGQPWFGSGKNPTGAPPKQGSSGSLHAEQHYEYHKPLRPGDILTVDRSIGKTWEKEGRRGGKMKFTEFITEYKNQDGELVVSARALAVVPERPAQEK